MTVTSRFVGRPPASTCVCLESRMAAPCSSHSRQTLPARGRPSSSSTSSSSVLRRYHSSAKFRIQSQRGPGREDSAEDRDDYDNSPESSEADFMKIEAEFQRIVQQNFDGLELQSREADLDFADAFEGASEDDDVTFWLEVDKPEEPKVEAQELFDWWNDLDEVYVLIFQLNDGEEDGIFTLKDSSEEENNNFILSFESKLEASRYGSKLRDNLQGMEAEIELMGRDELLQLCKELEVGVRIIKEVSHPESCSEL